MRKTSIKCSVVMGHGGKVGMRGDKVAREGSAETPAGSEGWVTDIGEEP